MIWNIKNIMVVIDIYWSDIFLIFFIDVFFKLDNTTEAPGWIANTNTNIGIPLFKDLNEEGNYLILFYLRPFLYNTIIQSIIRMIITNIHNKNLIALALATLDNFLIKVNGDTNAKIINNCYSLEKLIINNLSKLSKNAVKYETNIKKT